MWKSRHRSSRSPYPNADARVDLRGPLLAGAVAFVGAWSALVYVHAFRLWIVGDLRFYENWGSWTAAHQVPYRDFSLEYPPGALPSFVAPIYLRKLAGYHGVYYDWFRVEILLLGLLTLAATAWALRLLAVRRAHAYVALVFVGLAVLMLGPVAISRYDYWPAFLTVLGVAVLLSGRERLACGVFAAGCVVKIYPIVLLPLALVLLWRKRGRRGVLEGAGVAVAVAALGFLPFVAMAPHGLWHGMWRQASRPLQVESLAASFWVAAHHLGGLHLHAVKSYGSDNLVTPGAKLAATLSGLAVAIAVVAIWIWFARGPAGRDEIVVAAAACVVAYVAFNKVFSPQYLVWLFPLVPLVRGRRGLWATATLAIVCGLTQAWEPYGYADLYKHWAGLVSALLIVRDLLVVALLAVLVWPRPHAERAPAAAVRLEAADL